MADFGPVPSSVYITTCPQLAKAAMRASERRGGFDPSETLALELLQRDCRLVTFGQRRHRSARGRARVTPPSQKLRAPTAAAVSARHRVAQGRYFCGRLK